MQNLTLKIQVLTYFANGAMTTNEIHNLQVPSYLTTNIGTSMLLSLVYQWYLKSLLNPAQAFTPFLFMIKFSDSFYQLSLCLSFVLYKALLLSLIPEFSDCNPLLHGTVELLVSVGNIHVFQSL
jgi:hypothetical protein